MITAFIPARGGSRGIPNKNIKEFADKPLIVHSIEYSLDSKYVNEVVVSTPPSITPPWQKPIEWRHKTV
mgnify:CR=1 FL=1